MAFARVRTDNMTGTIDGSKLVSFKYYVGDTATEIENGNVVAIGALIDGEREVRKATAPTASTALSECALVAAPEVVKEKSRNTLDEFKNKAGVATRGYRFVTNNIFSVTEEAFASGSVLAKGSIVELTAGTKFLAVETATSGSTKVGTIIAVEGDYYVIEVA